MERKGKKIEHLIKEIREARSMSQMKLAEIVGVSYQQIQKYEKGVSKISIEKLEQISKALNIPVTLFFQSEKGKVSETQAVYGKMTDEEKLLLRLFRKLKDKKSKNAIIEFLKAQVK